MTRRAPRALAGVALVIGLQVASAASSAGAPLQSRYTSLQECASVERLELGERTVESSAFRCPGLDQFSLYVVEEDPRSFLVLERDGKRYSLERPMVREFALGDFPNVAGAKKAEWRLDAAGKAVGLIVRVSYMRDGATASALFVFDLRGAPPALLGAVKTNEEARALVEATQAAR
jgi:hypothetical protein